MTHKITTYIFLLLFAVPACAQQEKMTREDKNEKNEARTARINLKNDYAVFHRQMLSLSEYLDERKKIPALQKANKMPVKVTAIIDSLDDGDDDGKNKTLQGYIRQDVGDNATNMYEVTFDRAQKKIVAVKRTPEAQDAEQEDASDKPEKAAASPKEKHTIHKKNKDDDDDDDMDDNSVNTKNKKKDKDSDDD